MSAFDSGPPLLYTGFIHIKRRNGYEKNDVRHFVFFGGILLLVFGAGGPGIMAAIGLGILGLGIMVWEAYKESILSLFKK